jgi:hypothetical protein
VHDSELGEVLDGRISPQEEDLQVGSGGARSGALEGHHFGVLGSKQG